MFRRTLTALTATLVLASGTSAQQTKPEEQKQPPPPVEGQRRPEPQGQPVNIKLDLTITDQSGPGAAGKRTVSMILADGHHGSIRSSGRVVVAGDSYPVGLNLDAQPTIRNDNKIRLMLTLEYQPKPENENARSGEGRSALTERLTLMVENGKPIVISQAADPTSDRRISAELTATIMR